MISIKKTRNSLESIQCSLYFFTHNYSWDALGCFFDLWVSDKARHAPLGYSL